MQGYRIKYTGNDGKEHKLELTGSEVTVGMMTRIDDIVTDGECVVDGAITEMWILQDELKGWRRL